MRIKKAANNHRRIKDLHRSIKWLGLSTTIVILMALAGVITSSITIKPLRISGGIFWASKGLHYINKSEVEHRIDDINRPVVTKMKKSISEATPDCAMVETGLCQQGSGYYVTKTLITPAVNYQPSIPDSKKVVGYCTLCNDGTFSPSCAVGRGACSGHSGVNSYGVAKYIVIPGVPEVPAKSAVYSYQPRSYKDSMLYKEPDLPSLTAIIDYSH